MPVTPMFPLGTVLFPYALLPLHVFEERYRVMIRHVLAADHEFGVVLIERGSEVGGGDTRFSVATIARIVQAAEMPDGRFVLATVGMHRVRVVEWLADDPYPQARVEAMPDEPAHATDHDACTRVARALADVAELARRVDASVPAPPALDPDPVRASYEAAAFAPLGPLDAQRVLECERCGERLTVLGALLDELIADLRARLDLA